MGISYKVPPNADVALATYNGETYLPELLQSLITQAGVDIRVVASDDNSSDKTVSILEAKLAGTSSLLLANGSRSGVVGNFGTALSNCTAPYVALCDQDDVWKSHKLAVMIDRIKSVEGTAEATVPVLAFCDLVIVDEDLKTIRTSFFDATLKSRHASNFEDFLFDNHVPGCAMVFNRALLQKALPLPNVLMHDWWLILVAALTGKIIHVNEPLIDYRQHGKNVVGVLSKRRFSVWYLTELVRTRAKMWSDRADRILENCVSLQERFGGDPTSAARLSSVRVLQSSSVASIFLLLLGARRGFRTLDWIGISWKLAQRNRLAKFPVYNAKKNIEVDS